jgi:hypothetical protein
MLRDTKSLLDNSIRARDGVIGSVKDLYFDDVTWIIRYFVVETGSWMSARRVLIAPTAIDVPAGDRRTLSTGLSKAEIRGSPPIDTRLPVSRQREMEYLRYYGYAYYWSGGALESRGAHPGSRSTRLPGESLSVWQGAERLENARLDKDADAQHRPHDDHHLRSCSTVITYHVEATDGDIGHVAGYLVELASWAIRYLVVNTSNWWLGHEVLIAPKWIEAIRWDDNKLRVGLTRAVVSSSPAYSAALPLIRDQEIDLHRHYDRRGYWADEETLENPELKFIATRTDRAPSDRPSANAPGEDQRR